jgi:fibronectin type 3 domain-containing protein
MSRSARNGEGAALVVASPPHVSGKSQAVRPKWRTFRVLAALSALVCAPGRADVPTPPTPSTPPLGSYCAAIYTELDADITAFETVLAIPNTTWTPIPFPAGGSTLYAANLMWANGNTGPSISSPGYLQDTIQPSLQEMKALGVQAIVVPVLFPILCDPNPTSDYALEHCGSFYSSEAAFTPYLNLYTGIAQAVRAAGLKLIVDNEILFSNDTAAGWTNMNAFYDPLTWPEYIAARAAMAVTIERYMQPDYLMLANEPDTEAWQTGQQNLNNATDAAQMVQAEITSVKSYLAANSVSPTPKIGAGFGSWFQIGSGQLASYIDAYTALPLDYIDFHMLPVNTVAGDNFLQNTLTIAQAAAAVGKPVAITQAWLEDETALEVTNLNIDVVRARGPFDFWAPLNEEFMKMAEALANYTNMLYLGPQFPVYLFAYQPYGGTIANGGAANCTCTAAIPATATTPEIPATCSDYLIMQNENTLAGAADQNSVYTWGAFTYNNQIVTTHDGTSPTAPASLAGTAGYTTVSLTWSPSTDNVGVAGYNVLRCTPSPCTPVWIANTTMPGYGDSALTAGASYIYQVQAFDFAGNESPLSSAKTLTTYITSANAATNLVATAVSPTEISLSWSAPSNGGTKGSYQVYSGTSLANLQPIPGGVRAFPTTTYNALSLAPGTIYYFGVVASEQGISAQMSNTAYAITLPLPPPPSSVVGTATAPTKVVLTWQENLLPGGLAIGNYEIFQSTTPGVYPTTHGSSTAATYTATSLTPNTTYYFEIVASDTSHDLSAPSNQISVITLPMPAAPTNVAAKASSCTKVAVTWSETIPTGGLPISTYKIFRASSPAGLPNATPVVTKASPYNDTTVVANTTYYYAVEATDTGQDISPMSAPAKVTTPAEPAAPTNVVATPNSAAKITVTWSETVPPNGLPITTAGNAYTIYRGPTSTSMTKLTTRAASPFIDTGGSANSTYFYAITATDTGGDTSPQSTPAAQATTYAMPAAPTNVGATATSSTAITVTWSETIPPNGMSISNYTIYGGPSATGPWTNLATRTTLSYSQTGLTPGQTYWYYVTANDLGHDVSPASATANATTP